MPSYAHRPKKYFTRQEILSQLRKSELRWERLEYIFEKTIGQLLPKQKYDPTDTGYSEHKPDPNQKSAKLKVPKRRFKQLLYRLSQDGLINAADTEKNVSITKRGLEWLKKFEQKPHTIIPIYAAQATKSERVTIISYDIPERLHEYRDWLRFVLKNLKLTKLHQSVWIGKVKLPADFIADIIRLKLEKYIEIFEITKSGTLLKKLK